MPDRSDGNQAGIDRRGFLRTGAAVAATSGLIFGDWSPAYAADLPKRTLGRTGLEVTTISFGAIQLSDNNHARVLEHAIDQGINLVHVAPGYTKGKAIQVVGQVMRRKRDQVFIALKVDPGNIDAHLRTLNTDHVDILIPHKDVNGVRDTRMVQRMQQLQAQGKARFIGFATHDHQAEAVRAATEAGFWDCSLVAYNVQVRAELDPVLQRAVQQKRMGFLVMKGSRGLNRGNVAQWQAGLRNLLNSSNITSLTLGVNSTQHVDQNIAAVLQRDAQADFEFGRYAAATANSMCSLCGSCGDVCPRGVALTDYLRADLYRERGDLDLARELVRSIPARRSMAMCNNCGLCNAACSRQLDVMDIARSASRL